MAIPPRSTLLRNLRLCGLPTPGGDFLWIANTLEASLVASQPAWDDAVDANFSLRVLMQSAKAEPIGREGSWANQNINFEELRFHHPLLLSAMLRSPQEGIRLSIIAHKQPSAGYIFSGGDKIANLIVAPIGVWPDSAWTKKQEPAIAVPPMLAAVGAVHGWLSTQVNNDLLRLGNRSVLGLARREDRLLEVFLRPDGIAFTAFAPRALLKTAGRPETDKEWIDILLTAERGEDGVAYRLRLIGGNRTFLGQLKTGLLALVKSLRAAPGCPLSIDLNLSDPTPPIFWPLRFEGKQFEAVRSDAFCLDRAAVRCRIESGNYTDGGGTADAELVLALCEIAWHGPNLTAILDSSTDPAPANPQSQLEWEANGPLVPVALKAPVKFNAKLLAERLGDIYRAGGALAPDIKNSPHAFLPIERGWLQLPLDLTASAGLSLDAASGAFKGVIVAEAQDRLPGRIEYDSARRLRVEAKWLVNNDACSPASIKIAMTGIKGEARRCLMIGLESPSAEEALPTLLAGDLATTDEPLIFCDASDRAIGEFAIANRQWRLSFSPADQRGVVWLAHHQLPLTSNSPLTRTRVSGAPSVSRALFPFTLDFSAAAAADAALIFGAGAPQLKFKKATTALGWDPLATDDARPRLSAVLATLPGVELSAPRDAVDSQFDFEKVGLRFDLPILDEYFAGRSVERDDISLIVAEPNLPSPPRDTALYPDRLFASISAGIDALGFAAVQSSRALSGDIAGPINANVRTLAETFNWQVKFLFAPAGPSNLSIGSYSMNDKPYSGSTALAGGSGAITLFDRATPVQTELEGFAAPLINAKIDTRGLSEEAAIAPQNEFRFREMQRRLPNGAAPDKFSLATLQVPKQLKIGASTVLSFYCRDLPLRTGRFKMKGNPLESADGSVGALLDPDAVPYGLYEWRLYSEQQDWKRRFEIPLGPFAFRPLRLVEVEVKDAKLDKVEVLGALSPGAPIQPLPDDAPSDDDNPQQSGNLLALVFERNDESLSANLLKGYERTAALDKVVLNPLAAIWVEFCVERLSVKFNGNDVDGQPVTIRLRLRPTLSNDAACVAVLVAGIDFQLFGAPISVLAADGRLNTTTHADGTISISISPPAGARPDSGLLVQSIKLTLSPHGVEVACVAQLKVISSSNMETEKFEALSLSAVGCAWLNSSLRTPTLKTASSTLHLRFNQADVLNGPILGLQSAEKAAWSVRGDLALDLALNSTDWPDFSVAGALGEISATAENDVYRHAFWSEGPGIVRSRLTITLPKIERQSVIEWPIRAFDPTKLKDVPKIEIDWASDPQPLMHSVEFEIGGHELPLSRLKKDEYGAVVLHRPWSISVRASHELKSYDGRPMKWQSLDHVRIRSLRSLATEAQTVEQPPTKDSDFAFAPRYRSKRYRGESSVVLARQMAHPGIAERLLAAAGIPDRLIALELSREATALERDVIVLMGAGAHLAIVKDSARVEDRARFLSLPWITPLILGHKLGPLSQLRQQGKNKLHVSAADAAARNDMVPPSKVAAVAIGASEALIDVALGQAAATSSIPTVFPPTKIWALEQTFADAYDEEMPAKARSLDSMPFFVRTLFSLRGLFDTLNGLGNDATLRFLSVIAQPPVGDEFTPFIYCFEVKFTDGGGAPVENLPPQELLVLQRSGLIARAALEGHASGAALDTSRLRALAREIAAAPAALFVGNVVRQAPAPDNSQLQIAAGQKLEIVGIIEDQRTKEIRTSALRHLARAVYPSAALSWPRNGAHGPLDLEAGQNNPFQNEPMAVAGRSAAFGAPAYSPHYNEENTPYFLWSRRRVAFQSKHRNGALHSPTPRHLPATAARSRAPTGESIKTALLAGRAPDQDLAVSPILPGPFQRTAVGARPGVIFVETDAVLSPGGRTEMFDANHPRFGAPADLNTIIARQLRWPRSTKLPDSGERNTRRRTFVSWTEKALPSKLATLRILRGPTNLLRLDDAESSVKFTWHLTANDLPEANRNCAAAQGGDSESTFLSAVFSLSGDEVNRLTAIGVEQGVAVIIRGGGALAKRVLAETSLCEGSVLLRFDLPAAPADPLRRSFATLIDAATADDPLALTLGFSPSRSADDEAIARGPRTELKFVGANIGGRTGLEVELATAVFGDPAYDQVLVTETESTSVRVGSDEYILCYDRKSYKADETAHFAFGKLEGGGFANVAIEAAVTLKFILESGPQSEAIELFVRAEGDNGKVRAGVVYAIALRDLWRKLPDVNERERVAFGRRARLLIIVTPSDGKPTLSASIVIATQSEVPPAPGIYALVAREAEERCTVKAFASAPTPQRFEYPDLLGDLARGAVRRRGLFAWRFAVEGAVDPSRYAALIKIDQAGGGQMIDGIDDFAGLE